MLFAKFTKLLCCTEAIAPIEVESLLQDCCIFSWQKRATKGSSFFDLEKSNKTKKLVTKSGISF